MGRDPSTNEPLRVLHIGDDSRDRAIVAGWLRRAPGAGCDVRSADDVSEALRQLAIAPADVILLDLNLRSGTGLTSLYRLVELGLDLPVVALGDDAPQLGISAIGSGAEDFVSWDDLDAFRLWSALVHAFTRWRKRTPNPADTVPMFHRPVVATNELLPPGTILDRYEVEDVVGRGGMAVVYRVRHTALGSVHALKVLSTTRGDDDRRLLREGRFQARTCHPNLVMATDVLRLSSGVGLVMEYVDGPTLLQWMRSRTTPGLGWLDLYRGIVRGVRHAHRQGLVHRDLKPANVLLHFTDEHIVPKVTDFGIVKAMESSTPPGGERTGGLGTPGYMAPEQVCDAASVDQRADMFSLGCILYDLACGRSAFRGPSRQAIVDAVLRGRYRPPSSVDGRLPRRLVEIIEWLLEVDPAHRLPDCSMLLRALDDVDARQIDDDADTEPGAPPHLDPTPDPWRAGDTLVACLETT